ncbi:MAG TPA: BMC domain-containing protein, partial [Thermogutta sp.]|nr:BMC domain-containing protein [Thermogutta sp.]
MVNVVSNNRAIAAVELSSVGVGYEVEDAMLKSASVQLLIARTICSGKYLIIVGGLVSDVQAALQAGLEAARDSVIDQLLIPNVHESV